MTPNQSTLFAGKPIQDHIASRKVEIAQRLGIVKPETLKKPSTSMADKLVAQFTYRVPAVAEPKAVGADQAGPGMMLVFYEVTFDGDAALFEVQPTNRDGGGPKEYRIEGNKLLFSIRGDVSKPEAVEQELKAYKAAIGNNLSQLQQDTRAFNEELRDLITTTLAKRMAEVERADAFRAKLGIPPPRK